VSTTPTGTEARVCADIAARQNLGINKYGTTVADNPLALRDWLRHAYEEALDQAIYLRRAIEEIDKAKDQAAKRRADMRKRGGK
jgi:hypothetical protein